MKIIPLPQLRVEDFPKEEQKWLPQLFGPLNQFLTAITTALQNNLDFSNNTQGQQADLSFTWNGASLTLPLKFKITISSVPTSLIVCRAIESATPVILNVAWQYLNGYVEITDISKTVSGTTSILTSGNKYFLRVRVEA